LVSPLLSAAVVAACASGAASVLVVLSQRWHGKHTLDHDLEGVQKFHTTAVPRIGGAAIVLALLISLLLCHRLAFDLLPGEHLTIAGLLLLSGMPSFMSGIVEDLTKKVSVKARLLAALASALTASWLLGATVDELNLWGIDLLLAWGPFALAITAIVVAGGINAINIIDGFNGLAASSVIVMLAAMGVVGWQVGDMLVAELAMLGLGASAGFLLINYPTGRLFLGDGGAYFLGFWVAEVAVLLMVRNHSVNAWQILSILAYPVIEVLYSIYRRRIVRKASPGSPDGLHLHTLVYRRVVPRLLAADPAQPWKRNAMVVLVILPFMATAALIGVLGGATVLGGMAVVAGQLAAYLLIYARLVRGRWGMRPSAALAEPVSDLNIV
jgi:UDP-N-acetylmuramyl pentapeptide phosphotransferase/UDP-N-acetylglucosamine-1-phosphate transferase